MVTGDQTSMLVGAAVVLQRILTLTWSPSSVSQFNVAFSSILALAVAVRLFVEYSSLLEIVFAVMIQAVCFLTVRRVAKADDDAFRIHGRVQASIGAGESVTCVGDIVLRATKTRHQPPSSLATPCGGSISYSVPNCEL
jgi:predicted neutral ceramidase superfamily lipid hydrolase